MIRTQGTEVEHLEVEQRTGSPSMRSLLDLFADHLYRGLIPLSSLKKILALADSLPPLSGAGLERHLGATSQRTDFLIRATSLDSGREAFAGRHRVLKMDQALLLTDHWRQVARFFKAWSEPSSVLFSRIENVWLEFDVLSKSSESLVPSIFFDIDREDSLGVGKKIDTLKLALAELGYPLCRGILDGIKCCLEIYPRDSRLHYVGVMLSRHSDAVRICLRGLHRDQIPDYLQSVSWRGTPAPVEDLLCTYVSPSDRVVLDMDVSTHVHAQVGLEVFKKRSQWGSFFTLLSEHNLCSREEADKVLAWPGYERMHDSVLMKRISAMISREIGLLIRRLNHVKLTCGSSGSIKAKAYLYLGYA